jgi:mycofactocin precursor
MRIGSALLYIVQTNNEVLSIMDHQTQNNPSSVAPMVIPSDSQTALLRNKGTYTEPEQPNQNSLLEEEMLIEEVSIDGMCGVY